MSKEEITINQDKIKLENFKKEILEDFKLARISREASLLGRREVLTGKAKFGIFGDGKEIAQLALAKQFQNGDFRSGYYRDQTFMLAIGQLTIREYFSALYAHTDVSVEPASGGRQMGGHFATRSLNDDGTWKNLMEQKNSSADISPTAGQMARLVGLAQASKIYRNNEELHGMTNFTNKGNEVAFGTIGDASTSEGPFWESINAAGVLQVPLVMSVWDDGYGISVPRKFQTTKDSISDALSGFKRTKKTPGYEILITKGWDYVDLVETYQKAVRIAREEHVPVLVHVKEVNQPQGHSTSGSHERYKSEERMQWEKDFDCIEKFKSWILEYKVGKEPLATIEELEEIEKEAKKHVREEKTEAWKMFLNDIKSALSHATSHIEALANSSSKSEEINEILNGLKSTLDPIKKDVLSTAKKALRAVRGEDSIERTNLINWIRSYEDENYEKYSSHLYSEGIDQIANIESVEAEYGSEDMVDGRIILRENFEAIFNKYPETLTFGEDTGKIGGVNQSMEGMQEKFGELRVSDTGIRELTIIGQGIGMAMRGLRPIAEIQYLDYLLYAIQIMSDDLATVQYRTVGGQKAPLIIRTRGHRLEGIWHSGSPMGMIINSLRGVYVCVPRNMTKAAGFYNTLLKSDDTALVIEPLNGYRTKENKPTNLGELCEPLGVPEIVKEGNDITIVSYGSTFNVCVEAAKQLEEYGISCELVDVQTLIPFDTNHMIVDSIAKTNKLLIVDEDVSSGATGFILDKILNEQNGYYHLDSKPETLSSKDHRPAYGSDGDYFSKPSIETIFEKVYAIMNEYNPSSFPPIY
jgi:pyruvate/2-oxoglutarate/acetoin dehydrogenase E1 component/TPP-dependent pyruvate/acetoin dehydrogenase alpha subunit